MVFLFMLKSVHPTAEKEPVQMTKFFFDYSVFTPITGDKDGMPGSKPRKQNFAGNLSVDLRKVVFNSLAKQDQNKDGVVLISSTTIAALKKDIEREMASRPASERQAFISDALKFINSNQMSHDDYLKRASKL